MTLIFNPILIICMTCNKLLNKLLLLMHLAFHCEVQGHSTKRPVPGKQKHLKQCVRQMPTRLSSTLLWLWGLKSIKPTCSIVALITDYSTSREWQHSSNVLSGGKDIKKPINFHLSLVAHACLLPSQHLRSCSKRTTTMTGVNTGPGRPSQKSKAFPHF